MCTVQLWKRHFRELFFQTEVTRGVEQGWGNGAGSSQAVWLSCGTPCHGMELFPGDTKMEKKSVEVF